MQLATPKAGLKPLLAARIEQHPETFLAAGRERPLGRDFAILVKEAPCTLGAAESHLTFGTRLS